MHSHRLSLSASVALAAALLAVPGAAQGPAASESFASMASAAASGGGAHSDSFMLESSVAQAIAGPVAESETYRSLTGIAWVDPGGLGVGPTVLAVLPPKGPKQGGQPVQVIGVKLGAPGAGFPTVLFDGEQASALVLSGDTVIEAVTPEGTGELENPKGAVDVEVSNDLGSSVLAGGYLYLPALTQDSQATPGSTLTIGLHDETSLKWILGSGKSVPGLGLGLPGYGGKLELIQNLHLVTFIENATGAETHSIPIPDIPVLVGLELELQAASITSYSPFIGTFTNLLKVTIE